MNGCVQDQNGNRSKNAEVTAHGKDYVGSSKATTDADGRFEIEVRPDSELDLSATADGPVYSDARTMRTEGVDISLSRCLVVTGDGGIRDFPMKIKGTTGSLEICVRDHECEDGDKISVDVEGRTIFSGEIVNDWACHTLEVRAGESYAVELTALNGTGYKGNCSYADRQHGRDPRYRREHRNAGMAPSGWCRIKGANHRGNNQTTFSNAGDGGDSSGEFSDGLCVG